MSRVGSLETSVAEIFSILETLTGPTAPSAPAPAPAPACADRTDRWTISGKTKNWCAWAAQKITANRCEWRNLYDDCPVTCDSCSSTTPAPVSSTPAPVPSSCEDRTDSWIISGKTKNWCVWAAMENIAGRCNFRNLYDDCPVTCDSCSSTTPLSLIHI